MSDVKSEVDKIREMARTIDGLGGAAAIIGEIGTETVLGIIADACNEKADDTNDMMVNNDIRKMRKKYAKMANLIGRAILLKQQIDHLL
jgi:hypothetical protein